jgi:hypothetical protein
LGLGKSTAKTPRPPRRRREETILVVFRSPDFLGVLLVDRPDFQAACRCAIPVASHRVHPKSKENRGRLVRETS